MIQIKKYRHTVPSDFSDKIRLRKYLIGLFPFLETASAVKKAITKKQIIFNSRIGTTGDWVIPGSEIEFRWEYYNLDSNDANFKILFEDEHILILVKPPGIASSGNNYSFQSKLRTIPLSGGEDVLPFPYLIHRLDKATEGIMIAAKTMKVRRVLSDMIANGQINKEYVLIVEGHLPIHVEDICQTIDGQEAKTEIIKTIYLNTKDPCTKVYVRLHTGRTHQIRRHFSQIRYPIVGDRLYNTYGLSFGTGLLLCANYVEFMHPFSHQKINIRYDDPRKISKYSSL